MKRSKKPVKKSVAKVPMIMQLEALECGAACLTMILAYYGKWVPLERIRSDCGVSRDGSNAVNVLKAARHHGLIAKGYRYEPQSLKENGTFPCIIHWNFNHFVVLDGFKGNKAYLNDPARGVYSVPMETFDSSFTGICLCMEPSEEFKPEGKPKNMLDFTAKRLKGTGSSLLFTIAMSLIISILQVLYPSFSRVFLDRILSAESPGWFPGFITLLTAFDIVLVVSLVMQTIHTTRIFGKMAAIGNSTYMWKVLKLPMSFFSQRMAGDIQNRQESNAQIANVLINTLAPLLFNAVTLVFYLVVMLRYSWVLTLIGVVTVVLNIFISRILSKKRVNITRVAMRDSAKLSSATVSGIELIETIKSSGAENGYFEKWAGYQASVNTQKVNYSKLDNTLGVVPSLIMTLADMFVLFTGVFMVMQGHFSEGMILAFQGLLASFMAPALNFVNAGQVIQEMRTMMERVDDVMEYPEDNVFSEEKENSEEETSKLSGAVELKHVSFGYSILAEPIVKDFNLKIEPGQSVAIVGGSGCGKSTMSKLISGLYKPWEGEILFDGKSISEIPKSVFASSLAVVDQDIILFEDTIANNIKMWDDSIEDFEMILAARDAQLHEAIMQRVGGYQHKLIEGGKDFSGGQRQRIEIARVLAQDPTIIILDEATSALDAKTEYEVVKAIKERGITCIVVAHRLSTIRSCDQIIVLQKGEIVARGTHKELMQTENLYRDLVTSD